MKFPIVALTAILAASVQAKDEAPSTLTVTGDGISVAGGLATDTALVLATATDDTAARTSTGSISSANGIRSSSVESIDTILNIASGSPTISSKLETTSATGDLTASHSGTTAASGDVHSTSTGTDAGAMPTVAVVMGALMGGAALIVNM